jgi:hypothetical protein
MRPLNVAPNGSTNFVLFYSQSYSGLVCLLAEFLLVKSYTRVISLTRWKDFCFDSFHEVIAELLLPPNFWVQIINSRNFRF